MMELYVMLAASLNLMLGYAGLLSLAHAAFFGIGAYIMALSLTVLDMSFIASMCLAIVGTIVLASSIAFISLRLRGDYFVLTTLAFQTIVLTSLSNWVSVTRGLYGITDIPKPVIAGMRIYSISSFALFGFVIALAVIVFLAIILHSPFGRTLRAIRDDDLAAVALGKRAASFRIRSVAVASACSAVAGALYASYITFIEPSSFAFEESVLILSMVIIGGTGNLKGPILGAVILILLSELLRLLSVPGSAAANIQMIVYGITLIVLMRFRPQGLAGRYKFE
jgi:branched-chain amino acid transport system permease protein